MKNWLELYYWLIILAIVVMAFGAFATAAAQPVDLSRLPYTQVRGLTKDGKAFVCRYYETKPLLEKFETCTFFTTERR